MRLQSSYIFLMNPSKQGEKQPGKNVTTKDGRTSEIPEHVYSYFLQCFPGIMKCEGNNFLCRPEIVWEYGECSEKCLVTFRFNYVVGKTYLDVDVEGESEVDIIKCLEYIHATAQTSRVCQDYIMIISYDAASEFYCNELYLMLNKLERNLRKLLFNIYVVNFGKDYYKTTISDDIQRKAKEKIRAKGDAGKKEVTVIQEFFYSLEFGDIRQMLFKPKWTKLDEQNKHKFLEEHSDLSTLSDEELRNAFAAITPKSDWDRFFCDKMPNMDLEDILETIRKCRNKVAHCKLFTLEEYQDSRKIIEQLNEIIVEAIKVTEDKDFVEKIMADFKKQLQQMADMARQLSESIANAFGWPFGETHNNVDKDYN